MQVNHAGEEKDDIQPNAPEIDEQYLDELRGYRHDLLALQNEQITSYDKAILSLSGGALGITVAFADKFGGGVPVVTWALLASWGAFSMAIGFNVISYLFSSYDMEAEVEKVRLSIQAGGTEFRSGNRWRRATQGVNVLALFAFIVGVGLFGYHAHTMMKASLAAEVSHDDRQERSVETDTDQ